MHNEPVTSASLIEQAIKNDEEAWSVLCKIYTPLVYSWARRGVPQGADAADIVQEVFRILSSRLTTFRKESPKDSFRGWLWTITRNELRGMWRRQAKNPQVAVGGSDAHRSIQAIPDWVSETDNQSEMAADDETEHIMIRRAADLIRQDFQDHTWNAFWRVTVEGKPTVEVAKELSMSQVAVRQAKFRVLARFREVLE